MMFRRMKSVFMQNWSCYLTGFIIVFGLKYFYSKAGSDELVWILAPTARWVRILSGIAFRYEAQVGYVNDYYRFIIAPSCSGVQFMLITIATLIFSYVHRMKTGAQKLRWISFSVIGSCGLTIFVNGFRIVLSIYLPGYLRRTEFSGRWLTPERLHTITGVVIYFTALFIIYHLAAALSQIMAGTDAQLPEQAGGRKRMLSKYLPPVFWYFFIALGIPFLNQTNKQNSRQFWEYAMLITTVCLTMLLLFRLISLIYRQIGRQHSS